MSRADQPDWPSGQAPKSGDQWERFTQKRGSIAWGKISGKKWFLRRNVRLNVHTRSGKERSNVFENDPSNSLNRNIFTLDQSCA